MLLHAFRIIALSQIIKCFLQVNFYFITCITVFVIICVACLFQAACITQQSCTLAVALGTPIQLEDLTEDNGLPTTIAPGATHRGQQHTHTYTQTLTGSLPRFVFHALDAAINRMFC